MEKPALDEILRYARPQVAKAIGQYAADVPREHKEEIHQMAALRLIERYDEIEADGGWRSFVYNHARGAVLDYQKFGQGFAEERWTIAKAEEHGSRNVTKIRTRESTTTVDDGAVDLEHLLGSNGVYMAPGQGKKEIRWDLLARLASDNDALLAFLKLLRGFSFEEAGDVLGVSRSRAGQLVEGLIERFKSRPHPNDFEMRQIIWALGLAERYEIPDRDQSEIFGFSIGWKRPSVDLDSSEPKFKEEQMDLLGYVQNQI